MPLGNGFVGYGPKAVFFAHGCGLFELVSDHEAEEPAIALLSETRRTADHEVQAVCPFSLQVQPRVLLRHAGIERQPERAVAEAAVDFTS